MKAKLLTRDGSVSAIVVRGGEVYTKGGNCQYISVCDCLDRTWFKIERLDYAERVEIVFVPVDQVVEVTL